MHHDAENPSADGDRLAASVRDLAFQARRVLSGPLGHPDALTLSNRIAVLQDQLEGRPASLLHEWLESLRDRVDAHHRAGAAPDSDEDEDDSWTNDREAVCPSCPGR